MSPMSAMTGW